MKSNIRERNNSAEQWKGGISFHSIYYRYFTFIFALLILFFYVVGRRQGLETLNVDLSLVQLQLSPREFALYGNGILLLVSLPFYLGKKLKIGKEGIYLPGIKLFVPWEDINAVSHVWISEACLVKKGGVFLYNRKSIVFYRKEKKPICVYNISLLSLFAVKLYRPSMPTNLFFGSIATLFNIALNAGLFLEGYLFYFQDLRPEALIIWLLCYFFKVFLLPLLMLRKENSIHGSCLRHDSLLHMNRSEVIHI